jgi:hypothetical protein
MRDRQSRLLDAQSAQSTSFTRSRHRDTGSRRVADQAQSPSTIVVGALIARPVGAATVAGQLHVDRDPAAATFVLTPRATRGAGSARDSEFVLDYQSTAIEFNRLGTWRVRGFLTHETGCTDAAALLRYHGVYRSHDRYVAWLGFHLRGTLHRRRLSNGRSLLAKLIRIDAQTNAEPPSHLIEVRHFVPPHHLSGQ